MPCLAGRALHRPLGAVAHRAVRAESMAARVAARGGFLLRGTSTAQAAQHTTASRAARFGQRAQQPCSNGATLVGHKVRWLTECSTTSSRGRCGTSVARNIVSGAALLRRAPSRADTVGVTPQLGPILTQFPLGRSPLGVAAPLSRQMSSRRSATAPEGVVVVLAAVARPLFQLWVRMVSRAWQRGGFQGEAGSRYFRRLVVRDRDTCHALLCLFCMTPARSRANATSSCSYSLRADGVSPDHTLTHTHSHSRSHTRAHTHTNTHTNTHKQTNTHSLTHAHSHTHSHSHSHVHTTCLRFGCGL
jgi:hypothetical protein